MKRLRATLGGFVMLGFLLMIPLGCSDSDNDSSPIPPNIPTNRLYVMTMDSGILAPIVESASETNQIWEYTLILENVTENILWYTNRPERKSGTESTQDYIDLFPKIYGEISPNAALDGFLNGETLNDGLYLKLAEPLYDSKTNRLTFQVTLLGSTMTDPHPVDPVDIYDIKLTVLDNTPEGEVNYWSFGQAAQGGLLEPTGTEGLYKLSLNGVYPGLFQIQNAPGTRYEILNAESLEDNWSHYFSTSAPNSSLSGYTNSGELLLVLLELDNPSHEGDNVSYDARVLGGQVLPDDSLTDVTLLIDSPDGKVPLCSQSGAEAKCYNQCFPGGPHPTPLCCPKANPTDYNCSETGKPDWCDYTLCKGNAPGNCSSDICTTEKKPSGELTTLVIYNDTKSDVTVFLQVGAKHAPDGACPESWAPLQLSEYPCENTVGEVCDWTLKAGKRTTIPGQPGHCTNGTISFAKTPSDVCGMSLGEFTLNVDPAPAKDLQEGVDISLVNGNNGKIEVALGSSWKVQTTGTFVRNIENYEGTGANNQNKNGVYNYLCDTCTARVNPPNCSGTETCSTQETCNVLRDGAQQGGTVTFTWKGTEW